MSLSEKEKGIRQRLKSDFEHYAKKCLSIRAKSGAVIPLELNAAQKYIHQKIENQLHQTGKVRAIILKGRQQGCSTYVEGRYYWKVSHTRGARAFILTHEQSATDNLFELVDRYHEHCPAPVRPKTGTSSAKELSFSGLDSGYKVGTAGTKGVGRSSTIQLFHGSEVAFWPHADTHAVGVMQAIPDIDGTESILESTANGLGNFFHDQWKKAEAGLSDYIAIFVPWYWQEEYRKAPDDDFVLSDEELELASHHGLDHAQLCWRRSKIVELSAGGVNGETQFQQEYPMTAAEAFQMSGVDTLITPASVMRARKNKVSGIGPKIVGVDPSHGGDRFAILVRRGRKMYRPETYVKDQVDTLNKRVAKCVRVMQEETPDMMFVDAGFGADIVDFMRDNLGYHNVKAISFGSSPQDERKYRNKRAEMYGRMAEWLSNENEDVQVPDSDEFQADVCACPYSVDLDNRILIHPKKKIKEDLGFSPDLGDAAVLTFAETVVPVNEKQAATPTTAFADYNPLD